AYCKRGVSPGRSKPQLESRRKNAVVRVRYRLHRQTRSAAQSAPLLVHHYLRDCRPERLTTLWCSLSSSSCGAPGIATFLLDEDRTRPIQEQGGQDPQVLRPSQC